MIIVFRVEIVGGDKMLLIEKLNEEPLGDVMFILFVNNTCWPNIVQASGYVKKFPIESLVQLWVADESKGV